MIAQGRVGGTFCARTHLSLYKDTPIAWAVQTVGRGLRYVEHVEFDGSLVFKHVCALGLEGIVSKRLDSKYRSGRSKQWLKTRNPNAPAARRIEEGTFA